MHAMHLYLTCTIPADKTLILCYAHPSMPQTYFPDTYLRLDASSYHSKAFFAQEREMAENLGMSYHRTNFSRQESLPDFSPGAQLCLVTNTHTPIDKLPQELLDQTLVLLHPNSGYDNFCASWLERQHFPIILGNKIRAQGVSQYILSELLSYFNSIKPQKTWDRSRKWSRPLIDKKNILLIGHGEIGQILERSISALCPSLNIYDPFKKRNADLEKLLTQADVLIFACGLNKSSKYLLNEPRFQLLKKNILIINAARGPLIKQNALLSFLSHNPDAFCVLDVFEKEPFDDQFHSTKNIKTTSHIAGVSRDLDQRIIDFSKEVLTHLKQGALPKSYDPLFLSGRKIKYNGEDILI